jgi:hypothetical protein
VNDLITWLRALLDLDQAHAEKDLHLLDASTSAGDWKAHYGHNLPYAEMRAAGGRLIFRIESVEELANADAMLVARMVRLARGRAERVLREVAAKRKLVDAYAAVDDRDGWVRLGDWSSCSDSCPLELLERTVKILAEVCSDRPGFREEWRP